MDRNIIWVFDNDNTLYSVPKSLENIITEKIILQLQNLLGLSRGETISKRLELRNKYQSETTMAAFALEGLIVDFKTFIKNTYLSVDPRQFGIKADPTLRIILSSLPGRKYVFTNNPRDYARMISQILGISHFFEEIYGIAEVDFIGKPDKRAFDKITRLIPQSNQKIFIEDQKTALISAKESGFFTIKIGESADIDCDLNFLSIYELSYEKVRKKMEEKNHHK